MKHNTKEEAITKTGKDKNESDTRVFRRNRSKIMREEVMIQPLLTTKRDIIPKIWPCTKDGWCKR
jgi:hypothetical protein